MRFKKFTAALTALTLSVSMSLSLFEVSAYENKSGTITADVLNVRSGAGVSNAVKGTLCYGEKVQITNEVKLIDGKVWYQIDYAGGKGYVSSDYVDILTASANDSEQSFEQYMDTQGFPESYKPYLRKMHLLHPDWVFKAQKLGIDWNKALSEELVIGRNLVHGSALPSWKSMEKGAYDFKSCSWYGLDGSWATASKEIIQYYLDPRNFINDDYIFMFENLSYNSEIQNINGVNHILKNTFMSGSYTCPDTKAVKSYAKTFMEAAEKSGVSPYHLVSRCRNEQGVNGAPQSLGTVKGYKNYFNFFDVQAYATENMTAAEMGCKYAKTNNPEFMLPWTNQYKSIIGGSIFVGKGYITKGQDTLYLQKFDMVDGGNGLFNHQYMTCVFGQANEAVSIKKAYSSEVLSSALEFKIPVYDNMPSKVCVKPTSNGDNNNYLKSLNISGVKLKQSFDKFTYSYTADVSAGTSSVVINANALGKNAVVKGAGRVALKTGKNVFKIVCTADSGVKRTYTLTITKKAASTAASIKGDVNGDGKLDSLDALLILQHISGEKKLSSAQIKRGDMDSNGKLDVADALALLKKICK